MAKEEHSEALEIIRNFVGTKWISYPGMALAGMHEHIVIP